MGVCMSTVQEQSTPAVSKKRQMLGYLLLGVAVGILYFVPYMRANYYTQFQQATGLTNGQIGELASLYGLIGMFGYIPSGILADKFSARSLVSFSMVGTGCLILWHSTMPDFGTLMIIYGGMAVTSLVTFWAAFLKALRLIADEEDQGKSFGGNETLRWFWRFVISSVGLAILSSAADVKDGFVNLLIFSGIIYITVGVLCYIIIPKEAMGSRVTEDKPFTWGDIIEAAKIPGAWLISGIIFCAYLVYNSYVYLTPYFVDIMGMTPEASSVVAIIRTYVLGVISVFVGGWLADRSVAKNSTRSKIILYLFIACIVSFIPMFFITGGMNLTWLAVGLACIITFLITSFRGVYWAILGECGVGISKTGMVCGAASVIAYSSDAFIFKIWGDWLDANPGIAGYQMIFASVVVVAIVGCVLAWIVMKNAKANIAKLQAENDL